jgi:hypothetical protein
MNGGNTDGLGNTGRRTGRAGCGNVLGERGGRNKRRKAHCEQYAGVIVFHVLAYFLI